MVWKTNAENPKAYRI